MAGEATQRQVEGHERMTCVHWWQLATPAGPTITGICRHCGEVRTFASTLGDSKFRLGMRKDPSKVMGEPRH